MKWNECYLRPEWCQHLMPSASGRNIFQENWTNNFLFQRPNHWKNVHWKFLTCFFFLKKLFPHFCSLFGKIIRTGKISSRHFNGECYCMWATVSAISWGKFISIFRNATLLIEMGGEKLKTIFDNIYFYIELPAK